jgi:hypothetical protein
MRRVLDRAAEERGRIDVVTAVEAEHEVGSVGDAAPRVREFVPLTRRQPRLLDADRTLPWSCRTSAGVSSGVSACWRRYAASIQLAGFASSSASISRWSLVGAEWLKTTPERRGCG